MVVPLKSLNIVIRISMCIILLPFYCFSNRLNNRKTIRTGHRKNMFFLQITSAKSRHPMDDVGVLKDTHRPPGERPVSLLGFQLAARASTLFRILRPERACLRNSPARASDEAGPTCILQLRDVSLRSFVPFSTATLRIQVGPVSPDARAAFANGCYAPCLRPERAASGQTGKIGLGAISPHPPRGLGGRLSFSLFNARLFASLIAALLKSSQPRAGPGASLRSAEAGERSRAAHSKQRLLVVCLKPCLPSVSRSRRALPRCPQQATTFGRLPQACFPTVGRSMQALSRCPQQATTFGRLPKAASGFRPLAAFATPSPSRGAKGFAASIRLFPKRMHWPRPTFGGLALHTFRKGLVLRSKADAVSCFRVALPSVGSLA